MVPQNALTEFARLLARSLADAGVSDLVVSPGSRSTPYVIAAVREARIRCHSIVDERAAAFFALGQARVTTRPTALLCTSGSAAAHYFPAVVEAALSYVPLLLLTADRPPELHDCHAPQTIDQVKMFGSYARHFFDLVPQPTEGAFRALRRTIAQAAFESVWPMPGPVHVNLRAAKPLEPRAAASEDEKALAEIARRVAEEPLTAAAAPIEAPLPDAIARAAAMCRAAKRGLVVCGPGPLEQAGAREAIAALARATGFPVWADATSQLRFGSGIAPQVESLDVLFRTPAGRARFLPDFVIQIGAPPVSSAWEAHSTGIPRVVLASRGWFDPASTAKAILFGPVAATAAALGEACGSREANGAIVAANARAREAIGRALDVERLGEGAAVRTVVSQAPRDSLLVLGNSLAVRLVDNYCVRDEPLGVLSQRGASGIDGLVAGALGSSLASGKPVTLLLGDVSLLHDLTSLSLIRRATAPLVVVVLNNGGGRIFEQLPLAKTAGIEPEVMALTLTPHATDFAKAAALFEVPFARAETRAEVSAALAAAYARSGPSLVEIVVPDHAAAEDQARAIALLDAALAENA